MNKKIAVLPESEQPPKHRPIIEYEITSDLRAFDRTTELIEKICATYKDADIKIKIKLT